MDGPRLLREWRAKREITQKAAASELGISQSALSDYESGKKIPRVDTAFHIAKETGGLVPAVSWVPPEEAQAS